MKILKSLSLVLVLTVVFSSFAISSFAADVEEADAEDKVIISSIDDLPDITNFKTDPGKISVSENGNVLSLTAGNFANGVTNYRLAGYEAGYRFIINSNRYMKLGNISFDLWKNYKKLRIEFNIKIDNDTDGISFRTHRFTAPKIVSGDSNAYYIFSVGGKDMITPLTSSEKGYTYRTANSKNSAISKGEWHNVVIEIGANGVNKEVKFFIDNADVSNDIMVLKGNTNNNTATEIASEPMNIHDDSIGFGGEWAKGCALIPNGKQSSAFGVSLSGLKMTATNTDFTPRAAGKITVEELKGTANTETGKIDTSAIVYNLTDETKNVKLIIAYYDSEKNLADVKTEVISVANTLVNNVNKAFDKPSAYASAKVFLWTDTEIIPLAKSADVK